MRRKGSKQGLERLVVDEFPKKQKEAPKVEKSSKGFLALMDAFCVFVVQQKESTMQNQKMTKLMSHIVKGLGTIGNAPNEGSTKVTIKARLLDSFTRKQTKTKHVWPWLHLVKVYMETQHLEIDKK
jgi:hypothetical protein